jgi:two-component system response regulator RegA
MNTEPLDLGPDPTLMLVDDDEAFLKRLAKAMEKRGFSVETADSVAAGKAIATARPPAYAIVDLRLQDGNGLDVVEVLRSRRPECRIVVLTGYGAIATAVAAVKIGATDYLAKPADATEVTNALLAHEGELPPPPENPMSADRVR